MISSLYICYAVRNKVSLLIYSLSGTLITSLYYSSDCLYLYTPVPGVTTYSNTSLWVHPKCEIDANAMCSDSVSATIARSSGLGFFVGTLPILFIDSAKTHPISRHFNCALQSLPSR